MKTLCMDTAHKFLVIGLFENEKLIAKTSERAWKQQSEKFFPALTECMAQAGWCADDLDEIVITEGPGSYTGERIAMTIAKVLCTTKQKPLYTISTFQMAAGSQERCEVILDARSNRAYVGICEKGQLISEGIKTLDGIKIDAEHELIVGDIELLGHEYKEIDFVKNMMDVKPYWKKIEHVHLLVPHYLKSQEELVKQ